MITHNLTGRWTRNHKQIKAGVYNIEENKLNYLRPGYDLNISKIRRICFSRRCPNKKISF